MLNMGCQCALLLFEDDATFVGTQVSGDHAAFGLQQEEYGGGAQGLTQEIGVAVEIGFHTESLSVTE